MAAASEITKGAVVRVPAGDRKRPYCLEIEYRDRTSRATGNVPVSGIVLPASGAPSGRRKPLHRSAVLVPARTEIVRKGTPPRFKALISNGHWIIGDEARGDVLRDEFGLPWQPREYSEMTEEEQRQRRDPVDQMMDRVRQERGILTLSERLTYDLSVWHHDSAMELVDGQWKCTYVCKRCGEKLSWLGRSPWFAAGGDEECHGEVWVP